MRTVAKYIKPFLGRISLQMLIKISGTVIELFLPAMLSVIIDDYARRPGGEGGVWLMGGPQK